MNLGGKNIVVGIGGGIAAFKSVALVRSLTKAGANVRVVMTKSATRFVGPITFSGLTGQPAVTDLWAAEYAGEVHVELGAWADAVVVAPATMNLLSRLSSGMADDAVLATLACTDAPVVVAPAMHFRMWNQPSTQQNVEQLEARGVCVIGPTKGALASGEEGQGRMCEPEQIVEALRDLLGNSQDFKGKRVLVAAGPTAEDLDPVRFLSNRSTGKMGYAIARQAARRGADVVLISGPVALSTPSGVQRIDVRSALQMQEAIHTELSSCDVVVMAAAVADYRPADTCDKKIKKTDGEWSVKLVRNPDILAGLGEARHATSPVLVGFALETANLEQESRRKLKEKNADLIVGNLATDSFGHNTNRAVLVDAKNTESLPMMSKDALATKILDRALRLLHSKPMTSTLEQASDAPN